MPILTEVDKHKKKGTKHDLLKNFFSFMEADDKLVKKSLSNISGGAFGQTAKRSKKQDKESQMKVTYKAAIDTFKSVFDSTTGKNLDSSNNEMIKRSSISGDE